MVRIDKIYTKKGDKGITMLGDGKRLSKSETRFHAIGTVDELNSSLGVALLSINNPEMKKEINMIQNDLFDCGADLAVTGSELGYEPLRILESQVHHLEELIDKWNEALAPLNSFILPAGSASASYLHLARTIARRSERSVILLNENEAVNPNLICYLNRLSDYLFVIARVCNNNGNNDILWQAGAYR